MGNEVQLVSDGDGLAVFGEPGVIDRFLTSQGLSAGMALAPKGLGTTFGAAGAALQAGGTIAAESGRWLKMTEESARKVQELGGLAPTKTPGVSHAMIGQPGDIQSWIQVASVPGSLAATFANPAALASIGTLMAQRQMQQSIDELKEYLAQIDEKVDDILRAQKDAVIADMIGVDLVVEEAMTVRDEVGRVSEVTWSKVQASAATIAKTQAYALRQLDALAEKLERKTDMGELIKATNEAEAKVREWLAIIARCFQLQDALGVLELDRVLDSSPEELNRHRIGLQTARKNRVEVIARTTATLIDRLNAASSLANSKVLLNPFESPAVVRSSNKVVTAVVDFQGHVGIESSGSAADARRWMHAAVDVRDKTLDAGAEGVALARRVGAESRDRAAAAKDKALGAGAERLTRANEVAGKYLGGIAERARRRSPDEENAAES